jgi:UDP-N-acetylmuramyl pentapeptide synthase
MTDENLTSAAKIAKELGVSDAKVKKAIKELAIEPAAKRGVCNFYSLDTIGKIKTALGV